MEEESAVGEFRKVSAVRFMCLFMTHINILSSFITCTLIVLFSFIVIIKSV